jgi:hypothetical protein
MVLWRKTCALFALVGLAACGGDEGPDCVPEPFEPTIVRFELYAPGAIVPFANARLRQEYIEYDRAGCPAPQSSTYLRFEPLGSYFVRFGYRLDFESDVTTWYFVGAAGFSGLLAPTNDVLVSRDPDPIEFGTIALSFTNFQPL